MPRPRRQSQQGSLSPGQAHYVLDRLVRDRRVSAGEINAYVSEMGRDIAALEEQLARLKDAAGAASAAPAAPGRRRGRPPGRPPGRRGRPPGRGPGRPPKAETAAAGGAKRGRKARAAITPEQLASRQ